MIFLKKPKQFNPKYEVVGSFIQHNDDIILLHRQDYKPQGNTWGIPSGKIDAGESILSAACRETMEETGLIIAPAKMHFFSTIYVKFPDCDFVYHMFHTKLENKLPISINDQEHKSFQWISPQSALKLPLIEDLDECINLFLAAPDEF
jgi:8-oxo-dGTP diphosphatase